MAGGGEAWVGPLEEEERGHRTGGEFGGEGVREGRRELEAQGGRGARPGGEEEGKGGEWRRGGH